MRNTYKLQATGSYSLKNVRLETGFQTIESGDVVTITDLFCVEIKAGEITGVSPNDPNLNGALDAQGLLMLPPLRICTFTWIKRSTGCLGKRLLRVEKP